MLCSQVAEVGMIDAAGSGKNHSAALVVGLDVLDQVVPNQKNLKLNLSLQKVGISIFRQILTFGQTLTFSRTQPLSPYKHNKFIEKLFKNISPIDIERLSAIIHYAKF